MKKLKFLPLLSLFINLVAGQSLLAQDANLNAPDSNIISEKEKLVVVWTSGDREVALKMVFMYVYNSKKYEWWKDITLLVWGPSSKLLSEDVELQDYIKNMKDIGVNLLACKACADLYGVSDKLSELGITVKYTGKDLTGFIKNNHVVTF